MLCLLTLLMFTQQIKELEVSLDLGTLYKIDRSMLKAINCIGLFLVSMGTFAQLNRFTFEEVDSLHQRSQKPVVVFLNTEWCSYCAAMEQTTLKDQQVIELLNEQFYFVSFDVESKTDVVFQAHLFKFQPNGAANGIHELAQELGEFNGSLSYPTTCFLNKELEIVFQYNELMTANNLLLVLNNILSSN